MLKVLGSEEFQAGMSICAEALQPSQVAADMVAWRDFCELTPRPADKEDCQEGGTSQSESILPLRSLCGNTGFLGL